jgi:hypothetical protein
MLKLLRKVAQRLGVRGWINWFNRLKNPIGLLSLDGQRLTPISDKFGLDRGMPIDRYYIGNFLSAHSSKITGRVLEVAEDFYSKKFGRDCQSYNILHVEPGHDKTTIVGDLTKPDELPEGIADCFICTQTFNFIFDVDKAVKGASKLLTENGVLLASMSGISQISRYDMGRWGDYWRFTPLSAELIFKKYFREVHVSSVGNVFIAKSFLDGLAVEDIGDPSKFSFNDPDYPLVVFVYAVK